MEESLTRRAVLAGVGSATAAGVAGCGGDGNAADGTDTDDGATTDVEDGNTDDGGTDGPATESGNGGRAFTATAGTDWPTWRATAENNTVLSGTSGPEGPLEVAWTADGSSAYPAVVDGMAYVDAAERIKAIEVTSGEQAWEYTAENSGFMTPTVIDDALYTFEAGGITALDRATGDRLWTDETITGGSLAPVDGLLVGANLTEAYAFDPSARELRWTTPIRDEDDPDWNDIARRVADRQHLYVLEYTGLLSALDIENGEVQWTRNFPANNIQNVTLNAAGDAVYLQYFLDETTPGVRAMDARTGEDRWTKPTGAGQTTPVVTADELYLQIWLQDEDRRPYVALDPATGERRRELTAVEKSPETQPVLAGGTLIHWAGEGTLGAVDVESDTVTWTYEGDLTGDSSLVVTEDAVFANNNGELACLQSA